MIRQLVSRGRALGLVALVVLCATAFAGTAQARWLRAESPLFVVYSDGKEDELRTFVGQLHEYDALMRLLTGTTAPPSPNKLPIYLTKNARQLREAIPYAQDGIAGLYNSTPHATLAVALRQDLFGLPARTIILHEYAHHFMLQYRPAFYPAWYVEGFAEYFGATQFKDDVLNVGAATPGRAWSLQTRPWAHIREVIDPPNPRNVTTQFYEESWLAVSWFMADPQRREQLPKFLMALGQGEAPEKALIATTGLDFDSLDAELRAYLKKRELPGFQVKRAARQAPPITVEALSDAEDKFLLMNARLVMNYDKPKEVARLLPKLRKGAAKFEGNSFVLRTLALAEIKAGDFDNADRTLARLEATAPNDVNTPYLQALRYIEDGRARPAQRDALWQEARSHATRAFQLDENHYPSLYLYSLAAMAKGGTPDENTVNVLLRAYELAPNVEEFRLESAIALLRTGMKNEARQLLLPLAYAPHFKNGADYARDLLDRMRSGEDVAQALGNFVCACGPAKGSASKEEHTH
ncbi:MAG: hypothetical protein AB7E79_12850 [Rhodospirillaceae bacterium]